MSSSNTVSDMSHTHPAFLALIFPRSHHCLTVPDEGGSSVPSRLERTV